MRKLIYGLVALATIGLLATSCKKEETYSFVVPSGSILVSMPGEEGTTSFDSFNIASIDVPDYPKGWEIVNIDLYNSTITVKAPSKFDDEEEREGYLSLIGYTPQGTRKNLTIYLAIVESAVDYSDTPANCYIANKPKTRYIFDPYTGGNGIKLETESVKLLWQTEKSLINYLDLRDGKVSFYLAEAKAEDDSDEPTNKVMEGNALIGGYDKAGKLIWSWHIWVTNGDPREETITLNGEEMMNRNLGAFTNSNGSTDGAEIFRSYGMYYQWGNKTPFVGPQRYNFPGNHDDILYDNKENNVYLEYEASSAKVGSLEWSNANPIALIKGNKDNDYDWLFEGHDNTLWSEDTKTDNDPCPAGWRVPSKSVFENLTIVSSYDEMAWEEAQPLYGWMLEYTATGAEHFFTAQGRRNYLDCRLDIINDDLDQPIPWTGYYWTASVAGADASALFFDLNTVTRTWNGIEVARSMHRANALPVRCVRE